MRSAIIAAVVAAVISAGASTAATSYISGSRIKPRSVAANRLTPAAVKMLRGQAGPQGRQGQQGQQGQQGPPGVAGGFDPSKVHQRSEGSHVMWKGAASWTVSCLTGEAAINGTVSGSSGFDDVIVTGLGFSSNRVTVNALNLGDSAALVTPTALCAGR